jgi:hypothetical protein
VATSHDTALPGHHKADNDFSALWRGSETQIKLFYVGRGVLFYYELTPSAIRREGDDAIVISRVAGVWTVQEWSHNMTDTKIQEFSMDSQI